jgi:hypothetical protein
MSDHDWQRSTGYPSFSDLLAFLEADLDRGLRLSHRANMERDRQPAEPLLKQVESADADTTGWLARASARHIQTLQLGFRAHQFGLALAEVRRLAGAEGERK